MKNNNSNNNKKKKPKSHWLTWKNTTDETKERFNGPARPGQDATSSPRRECRALNSIADFLSLSLFSLSSRVFLSLTLFFFSFSFFHFLSLQSGLVSVEREREISLLGEW